MRFWDASAVVPLLVAERPTVAVRRLLRADARMAVWALTPLEVLSALWRRQRGRELAPREQTAAEQALHQLEQVWSVIADIDVVERRARRLIATHALRAADAAQLAAALVACDERPELLPFVTLDDRLGDAARREGFAVVPG
jgi:hypothetical protein